MQGLEMGPSAVELIGGYRLLSPALVVCADLDPEFTVFLGSLSA